MLQCEFRASSGAGYRIDSQATLRGELIEKDQGIQDVRQPSRDAALSLITNSALTDESCLA
jgi:hypothetical protein